MNGPDARPVRAKDRERLARAATDRERLVHAAYATPAPLQARAGIYEYERDRVVLTTWVLDQIESRRPWQARDRVLDIGCGPGGYLSELRDRAPSVLGIGFDLSPGMARAARSSGAPTAVADAMRIPVRSGSCPVALAAHMLYHVPDIAQAAAELARVVGPDGLVAVVTNGRDHLGSLFDVVRSAVRTLAVDASFEPRHSYERFALDIAPSLLAPALHVVAQHQLSQEIAVPSVEPLAAYVESTRSLYELVLPSGVTWAAVVAETEQRFRAAITRDGVFTTRSDVGLLLCAVSRT